MNSEEIINIRECQLEEMQQNKTDYTQVNILEMKVDRLNNIIKEIREYIKNIPDDEFVESEHFTELLEILDKENK